MGRLSWDKPSVTIRTEFFKPEKGRYIHPTQHRAITHFEAARSAGLPRRLSFRRQQGGDRTPDRERRPDPARRGARYVHRKGPCLDGRTVKNAWGDLKVLDLYAGAGGLSAGFQAGSNRYTTVRAVEHDIAAAATYTQNFGDVVYPATSVTGFGTRTCVISMS